jgi:glucose/arabinose dehydrogenase
LLSGIQNLPTFTIYFMAKNDIYVCYLLVYTVIFHFILFVYLFFSLVFSIDIAYVHASSRQLDLSPIITNDPDLEVQLITDGLEFPTAMAFLGPEDILVIEKNTGKVRRIMHDKILEDPLLDVPVANKVERGLLGLAVAKEDKMKNISSEYAFDSTTNVFLFFTVSSDKGDGSDRCERKNNCSSDGNPQGHHLYKYNLKNGKLTDPLLLLDLPPNSGADHLGGNIVIGPDKNIYLVTGDGDSCEYDSCKHRISHSVIYAQTANFNGDLPQGRGGILRVTQDGNVVINGGIGEEGESGGILGGSHPLDMYYAYGIRNSFGIDFDPVTRNLWDTENGPGFGDEINLVEPGFNSGWAKAQGVWSISNYDLLDPTPQEDGYSDNKGIISDRPNGLVDFNKNGKYSNPEFTWNVPVGVTSIKFFNSDKLGKQYENNIFVGDIKFGDLYSFDLAENRTKLILRGELIDKIADDKEELEEVLFARGFGGVTDVEVGPDGYLYVLSASGSLYKILKSSQN